MNKLVKQCFLLIFVIFVSFYAISIHNVQNNSTTLQQHSSTKSIVTSKLSSSGISINGNAQLASAALPGGDGSSTYPYIIQDLVIQDVPSYGVSIQNTDKYFILSNITVFNCSIGFYFYNITHGTVQNSHSYNNSNDGFYLYSSSYNTFTNNIVYNNSYGFYINYSNNTLLTHNTAYNNSNTGFYNTYNSNFNNYYYNIAINNSQTGFVVVSNNNTLQGNYGFNNYNSFLISSGYYNLLQNNTAISDSFAGFKILYSVNNTFINNTALNNGYYAFALSNHANNTILINNTAINTSGSGFWASSNSFNVYSHNLANNSGTYGFYLQNSLNNTVDTNQAYNNFYGYFLQNSLNNTVDTNQAYYNYYGFYISNTNYTIIENNIGLYSISMNYYESSTYKNTLNNNTFSIPNIAPSSPLNLQVTSGSNDLALQWQAPTSDGGSPITNYYIYRSTTSGGVYTLIDKTPSLAYTDSTVSSYVTYYYVVTAGNAVGESPYSNEASAILNTNPPNVSNVPDAPLSLTGYSEPNQAKLQWQTPISDGGSPITDYSIYRSTTSGSGYTLIDKTTYLSYVDNTVNNGITYYYVVTAVNAIGESVNSNEISVVPTNGASNSNPSSTSTSSTSSSDSNSNTTTALITTTPVDLISIVTTLFSLLIIKKRKNQK